MREKKYYPIFYWGAGNRIIDKRKPIFSKDEAQRRARGGVSEFFAPELRPYVKIATKKVRWKI